MTLIKSRLLTTSSLHTGNKDLLRTDSLHVGAEGGLEGACVSLYPAVL